MVPYGSISSSPEVPLHSSLATHRSSRAHQHSQHLNGCSGHEIFPQLTVQRVQHESITRQALHLVCAVCPMHLRIQCLQICGLPTWSKCKVDETMKTEGAGCCHEWRFQPIPTICQPGKKRCKLLAEVSQWVCLKIRNSQSSVVNHHLSFKTWLMFGVSNPHFQTHQTQLTNSIESIGYITPD